MNAPKGDRFDDRLSAAAKAKQAMLERFRARPGPDDPAVLERQAAQKAIAEARDARIAERNVARQAEAARRAAEQAAQQAEARARAVEAAAQEAGKAARAAALVAEQKAARDARYAARKARRR